MPEPKDKTKTESAILSYYLESLREKIQEAFKEQFSGIPGSDNLTVGIWTFKLNANKEHLETIHFIPRGDQAARKKQAVDSQVLEKINETEIPKGYGSIGYASETKRPLLILDTEEDPRGTVLDIDRAIGQQSAICYPICYPIIKNNDGENVGPLLAILDIFCNSLVELARTSNKYSEIDKSEDVYKRLENDIISALDKLIKLDEIGPFFKDYLEFEKKKSQRNLFYEDFVDHNIRDADDQERFSRGKIHENIYKYIKNYGIEFYDRILKGNLSFFNLELMENVLQTQFEWCSIQAVICPQCPFEKIFRGKVEHGDDATRRGSHCFFSRLFGKKGSVADYEKVINEDKNSRVFCIRLQKENEQLKTPVKTDFENIANEINAAIAKYDFKAPSITNGIIERKTLQAELGDLIEGFEEKYLLKNGENDPLLFYCWLIYIDGKGGLFPPFDVNRMDRKLAHCIKIPSSYLPLVRMYQLYDENKNDKDEFKRIINWYSPSYEAYKYNTKIKSNEKSEIVFEVYKTRPGKSDCLKKTVHLESSDREPFYRKLKIVKENRFFEFVKEQITDKQSNRGNKDKLEEILDLRGLEGGGISKKPLDIRAVGESRNESIRFEDLEVALYLPEGVTGEAGYAEEEEFIKKLIKKAETERANLKLKENLKLSAMKSAIAGVISRNMSHNIGSHVIPRASISQVNERLGKISLSDTHKTEIVRILKERLDDYLQRKADFTAEIITEPLISTKKAHFVRDVLVGFLKNTLLIDNIAKNENYKYNETLQRPPLIFKVYKNGTPINYKFSNNSTTPYYFGLNRLPTDSNDSDFIDKNLTEIEFIDEDVPIELPGPLGEFAFYNIFENLIRNTAKHNEESSETLIFYIDFKKISDNEDIYDVEIWNNQTQEDLNFKKEVHEDGDNITFRSLKEWLEHCVTTHIIDQSGNLRSRAWGIAEMKVMASLLRGSTDYSKMKDIENFNVGDRDGKLSYIFKVMRPKRLIGVLKNAISTPEHERQLRKDGVYLFGSGKELCDFLKTKKKSPAGFQFAIFDQYNESELSYYNGIKHLLPFRTIRILDKQDYEIIMNCLKTISTGVSAQLGTDTEDHVNAVDPLDSLEHLLYSRWIKKTWGEKKISLNLYCGSKVGTIPNATGITSSESNFILFKAFQGGFDKNIKLAGADTASFYALWDRHAGGYRKLDQGSKTLIQCQDNYFVEVDKNSSDFVLLFSSNKISPFLLAESALLKILVIDERVAEKSLNEIGDEKCALNNIYNYDGSRKLLFVAKKAGIFIATHLNNKPLSESVKKVGRQSGCQCSINLETEPSFNLREIRQNERLLTDYGIDIIVIHQGILDNLSKDYGITHSVSDFLGKLENMARIGVVIESGRGIPPELKQSDYNKLKFLPFSLIHEYLLKQKISKIRLTHLLMGLVRRSENDKTSGNYN